MDQGVAGAVLAVFTIASTAAAQTAGDEFGTRDQAVTSIGAASFTTLESSMSWLSSSVGYRSGLTVGGTGFRAGLDLPSGVLVESIELEACDASATAALTMIVRACESLPAPDPCQTVATLSTGVADEPGCARFPAVGGMLPYTIDNDLTYYIQVTDEDQTFATTFRSVRVRWKRQVSPGPATASFTDVPTSHFAFRFVEALAAAGITGGCGGGQFCPDAPLTRAQMAIFLATALGLHWPD